MKGTVIAGTNNLFTVECEDEVTRNCTIKGKVIKTEKEFYNPIAPGDVVEIEPDELNDEKKLSQVGEKYSPEVLYWIGYLYRYWASSRKEKSRKIYRIAPAKTMKRNFMAFHTFDPDIAIDDLIEIHKQKKESRRKRAEERKQ